MVLFSIHNKEIAVGIFNEPQFSEVVAILKNHKCTYNPKERLWTFPAYKYNDIKTNLEDITVINDDAILATDMDNLIAGECDLEVEKVRRIPDYSILNFPPIKGKTPNENFQKRAISNCINFSRRAEFLGMGSGKSYIASAIIAHRLLKYKDCGKVLFLTTSIGVRNLYYELIKFIKDIDKSRICVADKNNRTPFTDEADIVIASYNTFRLICNTYKEQKRVNSKTPKKPFLPLKEWAGGEELMLILDESHCIANQTSQQGYYVWLHSGMFKYRYLFSGTPADKPEKLYNQYTTLSPWLTWNLSFTQWKDKMAILGDRFSPYAIKEWKIEELEKQNKRFTEKFGEYFKTTDLVDLPNYNEKKIYLEMSPAHRKIYEGLVESDLGNLKTSRDIINRFPYMCLGLDCPPLLDKHRDKFDTKLNRLLDKFNVNQLEKVKAIEDIISDHSDEKIIIWAIHPATIKMLGDKLSKHNPICITGETEQEERFSLVEEFKKGDHQLLIANIACLNTSVTILESHVQIYVERGFSFSQYEQSTQRSYRIGQEKDVVSYILIYNRSLDVLVDKNLMSKGSLVDGLCSKNFISQDEWIKIFNCTENDEF